MRNRRGLLVLLLATIALLIVAYLARQRVLARPLVDGHNVVAQQKFALTGSTSDDLVVWAESIRLEKGSRVNGDASLVGATVSVDSSVSGDLTAMGSSITLGPDAVVHGDAMLMGGAVTLDGQVSGDLTITTKKLMIAPDAQISGDVFACADNVADSRTSPVRLRTCTEAPSSPTLGALAALGREGIGAIPGGPLGFGAMGILGSLLLSVALCGLATLAVTVFPLQISRIEEAVRTRPGSLVWSGLIVLLAVVGVSSAFVVLLAALPPIVILLVPLGIILFLAFSGVALAGVVTLTLVFGDWLLARTGRGPYPYPPLVTAAIGSVTVVLALHLIALIPYGGLLGLLTFGALVMFGVGAALSTRLGTKPARRSYFVQG